MAADPLDVEAGVRVGIGSGATFPKAHVSVWAKGYAISGDGEEFQRVVPARDQDVLATELELSHFAGWPSVLELLYPASDYDLAGERCLLVRPSEAAAISVAKSEDRHGRSSIVAVVVAARIDWRDHALSETVARMTRLAGRLALPFAATLRRSPPAVVAQLRKGTFLASREFDLSEEQVPASGTDWRRVLIAVKEWKGIAGVATPRLVGLGANTVVGTRSEAERAAAHVDGFIDPKDYQLVPLGGALSRWEVPPPDDVEPASAEEAPKPPDPYAEQAALLRSIAEALERIERNTSRAADAGSKVVQAVASLANEIMRLIALAGRRRW